MANDQLYQLPVEALVAPTSQMAQVYQAVAEVLLAPTSQMARLHQLAVEVVIGPGTVASGDAIPVVFIGAAF